jgi:hypothetical protein
VDVPNIFAGPTKKDDFLFVFLEDERRIQRTKEDKFY